VVAQAGEFAAGAAERRARTRSAWRDVLRTLTSNHLAAVGMVVALVYVAAALVGPRFAPYPYDQQDLLNANLPPLSPGHLFGTDQVGRDMLSRLLMGIRISLMVGVGVTAISVVIGGLAGAVAGYYRGAIDTIISGVVELTWGFPLILLAVILAGSLGPGLPATVLAIGLVNWAGFARIVRGEVLSLRQAEFVQAARAMGLRDRGVLWRHIMPNVVPPTLVMASYYVALAIVIEAGLSFIGMGAQPPLPSLGVMIAEGRNYMFQNPWVTTIPGVAILLIVLALNFFGDGLRDALDPRLRGR
jgi:peptide/nickel transport system permease protein